MGPMDAVDLLKKWFKQENLSYKIQPDDRAEAHFLVKYPGGKQGHMFAIVVPKGRDLVALSSMTRVDIGQQEEMESHIKDSIEDWKEWMHEMRLNLIKSGVDWGIHMGKKPGKESLQAFNVSLPIWFDGLTKNELMHTLRRLWLAKLTLIHEIKFSYGPGKGKPGPVDDWENKARKIQTKQSQTKPDVETHEIEVDETMSFGASFDPTEWA